MADAVNSISGLSARYRADSITGVANGGSIASWPDTSGNSYTATQSTSSYQPTFAASSINSQPTVAFNGSSMFMSSNAPAGTPTQSVVAIIKVAGTSNNSTIKGGDSGALQVQIGTNAVVNVVKQSVTNIGTSTRQLTAGSAVIVIATYDSSSGSYSFYINGTASGTGTNVQTLTATNTAIGAKITGNEYFNGNIAELIVYSKILSAAERSSIDSYAQDRYAITVSDYSSSSTNSTTSRFVRSSDLTNLVLAITGIQAANTQTANYTLAKSDIAKVVEMSSANANTLTIPTNATVGFPVGAIINVYQGGAGQTTISPASGVTLRSAAGTSLSSQYSVTSLRQRAVDEWVLSGSLSSVMTPTIYDTFDRSDNASAIGTASDGGTWQTVAGTWGISSNQAYNAGNTGGAMIVRDVGSSNNFCEFKSVTGSSGVVMVRYVDVNNWYGFVQTSSTYGSIFKFASGSGSTISGNIALAANDVIRVAISGNTISAYRNGSLVLSVFDATFTTGTKVGIRCDNSTARFDNFVGGTT